MQMDLQIIFLPIFYTKYIKIFMFLELIIFINYINIIAFL